MRNLRRFTLVSGAASETVLAGFLAGHNARERLVAWLGPSDSGDESQPFLVDFHGVELVTASFLKSFLIQHLRCESATPILIGLTDETRYEVDSLLRREGLCALERSSEKASESYDFLGTLDPALQDALVALSQAGPSTATELHRLHQGRLSISITAWNNRLSELHTRRLVFRERQGRQWVYSTPIKGLGHGLPLETRSSART